MARTPNGDRATALTRVAKRHRPRDPKTSWLSDVIGTIVLLVVIAAISSNAVGSPSPIQPSFASSRRHAGLGVVGLFSRRSPNVAET